MTLRSEGSDWEDFTKAQLARSYQWFVVVIVVSYASRNLLIHIA